MLLINLFGYYISAFTKKKLNQIKNHIKNFVMIEIGICFKKHRWIFAQKYRGVKPLYLINYTIKKNKNISISLKHQWK